MGSAGHGANEAARRWAWLLLVIAALTACTADDSAIDEQASATATAVVAPVTVTPQPDAAATPTAAPQPSPAADQPIDPQGAATALAEPAPLGTYGVARAGAGEPWWMPADSQGRLPSLAIPVFDEPGGLPRTLLEVNAIDGIETLRPLLNWTEFGSPLAVRVLEFSADRQWLRIQAPTRPHDASTWVMAESFDLHVTSLRIEVDLASATLSLFDDDEELLQSGIVHGRTTRETPTHVTYVEHAVPGEVRSPAYGAWIISIASFSEQLGTFGGGGSPENFIHGTNAPELMGQRVSSGEIRLPDDLISELVDTIGPGTPVVIYDSSDRRADREAVLARSAVPAPTVAFDDFGLGIMASVWRDQPQAWMPCGDLGGTCRNPDAAPSTGPEPAPTERIVESTYLIARDDAGAPFSWRGNDHRLIPVYDQPGGQPRMLVDVNQIDGTELPAPLLHPTVFDRPLVLPVVSGDFFGGWLQVRVPVRPNGSTAWVRADDFTFHGTDVRIEFDLGDDSLGAVGVLRVFDGAELLLETTTRSGRESRPTPLTQGWVSQIIDGDRLSPAYGDFVIDQGTHSEALGTFGGGGQPRMSMSGTNQPETVGMQASSGGFRMRNESITTIVELPDVLGAPIFVFDSTNDAASSPDAVGAFTAPATTTAPIAGADPLIPSFA